MSNLAPDQQDLVDVLEDLDLADPDDAAGFDQLDARARDLLARRGEQHRGDAAVTPEVLLKYESGLRVDGHFLAAGGLLRMLAAQGWQEQQLEFIRKLSRLGRYAVRHVGEEADDEFRDLLAAVQDGFVEIVRAAARDGHLEDDRLTVGHVREFAAELRDPFPESAKGCDVFERVTFIERGDAAPNN